MRLFHCYYHGHIYKLLCLSIQMSATKLLPQSSFFYLIINTFIQHITENHFDLDINSLYVWFQFVKNTAKWNYECNWPNAIMCQQMPFILYQNLSTTSSQVKQVLYLKNVYVKRKSQTYFLLRYEF